MLDLALMDLVEKGMITLPEHLS